MNVWCLGNDGIDPKEEPLREALCTLGNGYFATRGAGSESKADGVHYPGTYLAGGYNRLTTDIAGRTVENEDLVNLPNWLPLCFRIEGGGWFRLDDVDLQSYRQELELSKGILTRIIRFRDREGRRTKLTNRRLVHMGNPHLAALEMRVTSENWTGRLDIRSALDGQVVNGGVERYRDLNNAHVQPLETDELDEETIHLKVRTNQSALGIAQAARTRAFRHGQSLSPKRQLDQKPGYVAHQFSVELAEGSELTVEKVVSLFSSRDHAVSECGLEAGKAVAQAGSFDELLESHALAWKHLWRRFDIELDHQKPHDSQTNLILHLYVFHLLQTTSMHSKDLDVGVPSRGWHGEAYRGHIFWDELFIFPLLNLRVPEITRALLMYRYRRLGEARVAARENGYAGAMYPWQSGSNGREESQKLHLNPRSGRWIPDLSRHQRHVNAAIAYNVYQYHQVTRDIEFLQFYGAEMFLEIARFWASIATYNEGLDRYEILGVVGPDEYHDGYPGSGKSGLNNNAYTNIMAVWVLRRVADILSALPEDRRQELCEKIELGRDEIEGWNEISRKMRVIFHDDGIISQFEGYDDLEEFDWEGYRKKYDDIQRLDRILEAEQDTPNRYKASKQADVLMLFYLFSSEELREIFTDLGYPFEYETIPKNMDYYLSRTSHGSTLSRVVHAWVLARSDRARSWSLFLEALQSDVVDIQGGTTPEGIHLGAMAGTVDQVQRGYTGIESRGGVLWLNPCLPRELGTLRMMIRYRGHSLAIRVSSNALEVTSRKCAEEPIKVGFRGDVYQIQQGKTKTFKIT